MIRYKTYDATGIAPNGRLTAGDMNLFQDLVAALTDLTQNVSVGSIAIGQAGLTISRFGAGEFQLAGLARIQGIARFLAGFIGGTFTTAARNAIAVGSAPFGLIILNSDTSRYEWNKGTDVARDWQPLSPPISAGSITATELATDSVTSIKILADAVTQAKMADNSVGTNEIIDGSVTLAKHAANSVDASKIVDGSVGSAELATDSVTNIKMANDSVGAAEIIDGSVGTAELATDAVTQIKVADNAIGTNELATDAVTQLKMADNSVGAAEIIDGSVGTNELAANAVTSAKILDGTIAVGDLAFDPATQAELDAIAALRVITDVAGLKIRVGLVNVATDGNAQAVVAIAAFPTQILGVVAVNGNYLAAGQQFWCDTWIQDASHFGFRATTGGGNGIASSNVWVAYIAWGT